MQRTSRVHRGQLTTRPTYFASNLHSLSHLLTAATKRSRFCAASVAPVVDWLQKLSCLGCVRATNPGGHFADESQATGEAGPQRTVTGLLNLALASCSMPGGHARRACLKLSGPASLRATLLTKKFGSGGEQSRCIVGSGASPTCPRLYWPLLSTGSLQAEAVPRVLLRRLEDNGAALDLVCGYVAAAARALAHEGDLEKILLSGPQPVVGVLHVDGVAE